VLWITPQAQIRNYRADFLRTMQLVDEEPEINVYKKQLIVECDGFDFHERTPKQAARDWQRDRELQTQGFNVFRYTGSEIWADGFRCAEQAVTFLTGSIEAQRTAEALRRKRADVVAGRQLSQEAMS
jgi:very-short-patch-repair endonuclease